jgi:Tol biopolymer transport system component
MIITVTRIIQRTESQTQTIPFTQQTVRDATVPLGQSKAIQTGRNGTLVITFRLTFEDGQPTERVEINRQVTEPAVPEVIVVGVESTLSATPFTGTLAFLGGNNAFVMRQATSNRRALTTSGDLDGRVLELSPDGKWLLYSRALTKTTESGPLNSLWVVDTVLATALPKPLKTPGVIWANWSPNGTAIAYSTATATNGQPNWRAANDLWIAGFQAGALGTPQKILEPSTGGAFGWWGANYEWSPNGKFIAIGSTDDVALVDTKTLKRTALISFTAYNTFSNWAWTPQVSWTPDSQFVIAVTHGASPTGESAESSPVFDIVALAADGSFKARLASEAGMWAAPRIGTSGIIFGRAQAPYASADSRYDLFKMDRDGSNQARLFPAEDKPGLQGRPDLAFSPDGAHIVVAYQRDLYFVDVSAGTAQQFTTEGNVSAPRWSR